MTVTPQPLNLQQVLDVLQAVAPTRAGYKALCPAHKDLNPSLSIDIGDTQPVVVKCHAGCDQEVVWTEIKRLAGVSNNGSTPTQLYDRPAAKTLTAPKVVATYRYENADESHNKDVLRYEPKSFKQRAPDGTWSVQGIPDVPFHLPQLIEGVKNRKAIYVVEGEKDVLNLEAKGFVATCNAGGAGKWLPEFNQYLKDAYVVLIPDWDKPGRKHTLDQYLDLEDSANTNSVQVKRAKVGKDISDHFEAGLNINDLIDVTLEELGYVPRETSDDVVRISDVVEGRVEWLWENRIPLGMMTIQDGDPDQGKSLMLMELAAIVSRDGVMPDGAAGMTGNVMILASEDNLNNTIKPRLRAAGAVQERIYYLKEASVPSGIEKLEEVVRKHNIKLLIIDPLLAYFDETVKFISEPSARKAMKPIGDMAERCNCAIVFNRHFNKDSTSGKSAMNRGSGSGAIGAQCRSSWAIGSFPTKADEKYMAHGKKNLSPITPPTLKFHIESNSEGLPHIVWDGESEITADQIVGATYTQANGEDSIPEIQRAQNFLSDLFKDLNFMAAKEIIELAAEDGISERTIRRAKANLSIPSKRLDATGGWVWGTLPNPSS